VAGSRLIALGRIIVQELMRSCARIAALVLVLVGMTSSLAAQLPFVRDPARESPGCHEHGSKPPAPPLPADHACCVAGHHSAILRPMCAAPTAWRNACEIQSISPSLAEIAIVPFPARIAVASLPPGTSPLRI
jgi:hypothetical protein